MQPVDPLLTLFILIAFLLLGLICVLLYFMYKKEKAFEEEEHEILGQYQSLISHTFSRARSMLRRTNKVGKQLLDNREFIHDNLEKTIGETIQKIVSIHGQSLESNAKEFQTLYQNALSEVKNSYLDSLKLTLEDLKKTTQEQLSVTATDIKKDILEKEAAIKQVALQMQQEAQQEYQTLSKSLKDQELTKQTEFDALLAKELEAAKQDIQKYKAEQLKKIDESVAITTKNLLTQILGVSISKDDHEKLVIKALEEAKRDGTLPRHPELDSGSIDSGSSPE